MDSKLRMSLLALSFLVSLSALSFAQLGEQAGQPNLNVTLGGSAIFNYSILNAGSSPIGFTIISPALNTIPHNATPSVSVTPMNGTLAPHSQQTISIRVLMPQSDKVGLTWQGVVQVVEASPVGVASNGGASAVITAGVAKILTVHSIAAKGLPLIYYIVIAIVVVAAAGGAGSYFVSVRRKKAAAAKLLQQRQVKGRAKRALIATKRPSAAAKRKGTRKGARKKPSGKKGRKPTTRARKPTTKRAKRTRRRVRR